MRHSVPLLSSAESPQRFPLRLKLWSSKPRRPGELSEEGTATTGRANLRTCDVGELKTKSAGSILPALFCFFAEVSSVAPSASGMETIPIAWIRWDSLRNLEDTTRSGNWQKS